ncbi:MAG TPA: aspartate aminotransferase family protein, partial [Verrucomicrobiota bacterium]|nr:aspartate aminotransferase family protein [Verrucomicrobiota bacterium]
TWLASDRALGRRLMLELLRRRVFLNPMGTKLYLSLAHGETVIEDYLERFAAALTALLPASHAPC